MEGLRALGLTPVEYVFFLLLRAGLWVREIEDLQPFPLTAESWDEVMQLARKQTVQGVVLQGVQQLPPHLMPDQQQLWSWMPWLAHIEVGYHRVQTAAAICDSLLRGIGAEPLLQKGISVARYYEQPQWRVNGDIDWYVGNARELQRVAVHLQNQGYSLQSHADGSISFDIEGVEIELHTHLTDLLSAKGKKVVQELIDTEGRQQMALPDGHPIEVAGMMTTLLMLESHLMKHLSTVGIGLRQFCDLARTAHVLNGHYDTDAFLEIQQRAGMQCWHQLLRQFLATVLGLQATEFPEIRTASSKNLEKDLQWVLRDVLRGGNFGQHTAEWLSQSRSDKGLTIHTLRQILTRLPFSLRYAPAETFCQVGTLAYHRIKKIHKPK